MLFKYTAPYNSPIYKKTPTNTPQAIWDHGISVLLLFLDIYSQSTDYKRANLQIAFPT